MSQVTQVTTHFEKGKFYFRISLLSSQLVTPRFIWICDQSDSDSDDDWSYKVWAVIGLSPKWRHFCLWLYRGDLGGEIIEQVKNGDWLKMRQSFNCFELQRSSGERILGWMPAVHFEGGNSQNNKWLKWWQIFHCVDLQHTWLLMSEYQVLTKRRS